MPERTEAAAVAAGAALLALAAGASLYAVQSHALELDGDATPPPVAAAGAVRGKKPPAVRSTSSARALLLAEQLAARDARMFGAWWCSHCADQKEALGREALAKVAYVECDAEGVNSQTALCRAEKVQGYPTWQIDGELFPGERDLDGLEKLLAPKAKP